MMRFSQGQLCEAVYGKLGSAKHLQPVVCCYQQTAAMDVLWLVLLCIPGSHSPPSLHSSQEQQRAPHPACKPS